MLWRLVFALTVAAAFPVLALDHARFLGAYNWKMDDPLFGGYSGLEFSDDGSTFTALSDRGHLVHAWVSRQGDAILSVRAGPIAPLEYPDRLLGRKPVRDTEGLAMSGPDVFVSFEFNNKVLHFRNDAPATALPAHPDFARFPSNAGPESLAIGPDGTLYLIPEKSGSITTPFPVYAFRNGAWEVAFRFPRLDGFLPTGADFDDKGRLYVLERYFAGLGFASRVRRFTFAKGQIMSDETLLTTRSGQFDNLEGIAVWRSDAGELRLTMISDDNFFSLQKTQLVEFAVQE